MQVGNQIDPSMLPVELQHGPLPLIGFFGLDIATNAIHKTIWDAFSANRKIERTALNFKLLPIGTEFPVAKPKTRSYEWYHPKGILKRNWLTKHLNILPSVVVLFQNLEWSDPQWTEKQLQCASHVQSIKNSLQGRNTQLIVVLIQKGSGGQSTQNDDLLSSERAANLTSMCDINAKLLFVLPYMDQHLMNYILRLESAFYEHSQVYYTQMTKTIRSHRDQLTSSHQGLMVRHQFKLGIISELRQDFNTALKHYRQGYNFLEEIRIVDTNCMEIKTVAGFINYKICKLMFKLNMPRDSITHFKTHIEKYKSRAGFRELQFEHFSWLAIQYQAFAELFCEAIRHGLPALQTQHPGKYYYKAAEYIGKRKEMFLECLEMPQSPVDPPQTNGTASILHSEFWGVRGAKNSTENTSESVIIRLIQEQEKSFNHSQAIITLLGQAMAQYKVYKCLRFRKKLAVDMAEEYLKCGDYPKALTLYSLMLADYRADKWYTIFTEILLKTLRSAYLSASPVDFICCSMEALSPNILIEKDERIVILENLWKVLQGVAPLSQQQIVPELKTKWDSTLETLKSPVLIDLDKITDVLDCKITFNKAELKCNETYQLFLFVRNNTDVPLKVRKFTVVLYDSKSYFKICGTEAGEYTKRWETLRPMSGDLMLEPGKCYKIVFDGDATHLVENIELQIAKIEIEMGGKHFAVMTASQVLNKTKQFKSNFLQRDCMELLTVINSCYVTPTFHLQSFTRQLTQQPMLVNEYFQLQVNVINNFDMCLQCVGIGITVPHNLRNRVFLTSDLQEGSMQKLSSHIQINLGDLSMQANTSITFYIVSLAEGAIELKQKLWYQVENNQVEATSNVAMTLESPTNEMKTIKDTKNSLANYNIRIEYLENGWIKKIKEDTINVTCVEDFCLTGRFYTLSRQALMRAYRNEDFIFRVNLEVKSPVEIEILELFFLSDHNITEMWHKNNKKALKRRYRAGRTLEDIIILRPNRCSSDWLNKEAFLNDENCSKNVFALNKTVEMSQQVTSPNVTLQNSKETTENFSKNLLSTDVTTLGTSKSGSKTSTDSLQKEDGTTNVVASTKNILISKIVYNNALDSLYQTQNGRNGFINQGKGLMGGTKNKLLFGVYCVKWKRAGSKDVNESKFMINGVDIIEPPLNIYCYLTQKVFAKVAVPFKITLSNPTTKVMYLSVTLNSAPSFMFAGHRLLNITLFSHSSKDLVFNLYALKAGWQQLPELVLQYDQSQSDNPEQAIPDTQQNELANLVKRWMPKWVFVHPPSLTLSTPSLS